MRRVWKNNIVKPKLASRRSFASTRFRHQSNQAIGRTADSQPFKIRKHKVSDGSTIRQQRRELPPSEPESSGVGKSKMSQTHIEAPIRFHSVRDGLRGVSDDAQSGTLDDKVFSGIQPTGVPHLGNYLGALRPWRELQDAFKFKYGGDPDRRDRLLFSIVDLHALTGRLTHYERLRRSRETLSSLLAIGLHPKLSTMFFQSHVPEHTELMWILSTVASFGYLSRMTQWKSKSGLPEDASLQDTKALEGLGLGLFSYPVLQAADILVHGATKVPVGEDQAQHIEFTRRLARSFNAHYCDSQPILREPEPQISPAKRIMSLRDPTKKMSKSDPNPKSTILINDTDEDIRAKFKAAVTDNEDGISWDPEKRPGISNLVEILKHTTKSHQTYVEIASAHKRMSKGAFKESVADAVIEEFRGIRQAFDGYMSPEGNDLFELTLRVGTQTATHSANETMLKVRQKVGIFKPDAASLGNFWRKGWSKTVDGLPPRQRD